MTNTAVIAWIEGVAVMRRNALADRIESIQDPRAQQIIESDLYPHDDGGEALTRHIGDAGLFLERMAFESLTPLPPLPLPVPAWATAVEVSVADWPEIGVTYSSTVQHGDVTAGVDRMITIFAEDHADDRIPEEWTKGDIVSSGGFRFFIEMGSQLISFDVPAFAEIEGIGEAVLELAQRLTAATPSGASGDVSEGSAA